MIASSAMDESTKPRLVTQLEIAKAVMRLVEEGVSPDDLLPAMTRSYYVDLDAFNELLAGE